MTDLACIRCGTTRQREWWRTRLLAWVCAPCRVGQPPSLTLRLAAQQVDAGPCVYRILDATGDTIYVGSSGDLRSRLAMHARRSPFRDEAVSVQSQPMPTLADAREREVALIRGLRPRWNFRDNPDYEAA